MTSLMYYNLENKSTHIGCILQKSVSVDRDERRNAALERNVTIWAGGP